MHKHTYIDNPDTDLFQDLVFSFENGFEAITTNNFEDFDPTRPREEQLWNFEVGYVGENIGFVQHPLTVQLHTLTFNEVQQRLNDLANRSPKEALAWYKWSRDYDGECHDEDVEEVRKLVEEWWDKVNTTGVF